jgi:hypothetical protein
VVNKYPSTANTYGKGITGLDTLTKPAGDPGYGFSSTFGVSSTASYPATLPPLSPEMLAALRQRRRLATREFEETEAYGQRRRQQSEARMNLDLSDLQYETANARREGMNTLAGRGVARSPIFANPFRRRLLEQEQRGESRLRMGLSETLQEIERSIREAAIRRDREYAQIDWDKLMARSNTSALLGI